MADYPRVPDLPTIPPHATAVEHGLMMLRYIVAENITTTLTDEDLALALHASLYVVSAREMSPIALERIQHARTSIARTLARRTAVEPTSGPVVATVAPRAVEGGQLVRVPVPPVPHPRTPVACVDPF